MDERDALYKLVAYLKCQNFQLKGIYEDCNEENAMIVIYVMPKGLLENI